MGINGVIPVVNDMTNNKGRSQQYEDYHEEVKQECEEVAHNTDSLYEFL